MQGERTLGTVTRADGSTWSVLAWPGYGVVAPAVLASNGLAQPAARRILAALESGDSWDGVPLDMTSAETAAAGLVAAYRDAEMA